MLALTKLIIYRSDSLLTCQYCWQWRQWKVLLIFQWNKCKWLWGLVVKAQYAMSFMRRFMSYWCFNLSDRFILKSKCVCVLHFCQMVRGIRIKVKQKISCWHFSKKMFISVIWIQFSPCTSEPAIIPFVFTQLLYAHG